MHNYLIQVFKGDQKIYSYTIILFILIMQAVVKVRAVNRSKFLAVPRELVEKIQAEYMAVKLDESGRLIYTPISEAV